MSPKNPKHSVLKDFPMSEQLFKLLHLTENVTFKSAYMYRHIYTNSYYRNCSKSLGLLLELLLWKIKQHTLMIKIGKFSSVYSSFIHCGETNCNCD